MRTRRGSRVVMALAVLGLATTVVADEPGARFLGETSVNVIEVPVRVLDPASGAPVRGLTAADFALRESGRPQEVASFVELTRPARDDQAAVAGGEPGVAANRAVEMVYFFDLYLTLKGDKERAVEGLRQLYRTSLAADERVSVVAFDGRLRVLLERSDDIFALDEALAEVEGLSARGIEQRLGFTDALYEGPASGQRDLDYYERRQRSREYFFELEKRTNRVGAALSATMARFAVADARKVVVAFTPGFPTTSWSPTYSPIDFLNAEARYPAEDLWQGLAREASDLGFVLNVVDSSGVRTSTAGDAEIGVTDEVARMFAEGEVFGPANRQMRLDPSQVDPVQEMAANDPNAGPENLGQWLERSRKNLLANAAQTTGGSARFASDVGGALTEIAADLEHCYVLSYVAPHLGDGQVYEIEVTVVHQPGYRVIHRTSYVDQPVATRQAQRLRSVMLFGGDANPLGIRVERGEADSSFRLGATGSKRVRLPLAVKIPFSRLEMIPAGEQRRGSLLVTFFGEDGEGNQSQLASAEQAVTVAEADYAEAVARGYFSYKATVEVEGGQQKVYVGVQDQLSGRTSVVPLSMQF